MCYCIDHVSLLAACLVLYHLCMHACQNLYNSSALRDVSELVQLVCNYVTNGVLDVAVMVNEPTQQMRFYDEYRVIRFDDALPVLTISCSIVNLYQRNTHTHTYVLIHDRNRSKWWKWEHNHKHLYSFREWQKLYLILVGGMIKDLNKQYHFTCLSTFIA